MSRGTCDECGGAIRWIQAGNGWFQVCLCLLRRSPLW
jgi:hypothetical protein